MSDLIVEAAEPSAKPVLVFFRWTRPGLPPFLRMHLEEQVTCLRQWFIVHVINEACDYDEVCSRLKPDLCMFESGVYSGERAMTRIDTHSEVPKLGFLHSDAFDVSRGAFISDMINWGIEDFVTTSTSMADYTPEIADRLFVWPNFVNPRVFRDYSENKIVPVLFTGSQAPHYPWRNAMSRALSGWFPTMTCPHFGWNGEAGSRGLLVGERYSRMLNATVFVPACGTITNDVVRKHFEVPGSRSCLVAERTQALESAGFRHLVNVVFAEPESAVDQLREMSADPDLLESIVDAGYRLVHERHTITHRDQIYRWFLLRRELSVGERIVQDGPFGPLRSVPISALSRTCHVPSYGRDRALIAEGWRALGAGDAERAQRLFLRCLNFFFIPEAVLGAIRSNLRLGALADAQRWMDLWLKNTLGYNRASEPDPVQWATRIRVDLCLGNIDAAQADASRYPHLMHPELDRMRAAALWEVGNSPTMVETFPGPRPTVTPVPISDDETWRSELRADLGACGRPLSYGTGKENGFATSADPKCSAAAGRRALIRASATLSGRARRLARPIKRWALSADWERTISEAVRKQVLSEAVLLGARRFSLAARAVRQGLKENPGLPEVRECVHGSLPSPGPDSMVFVGAGCQSLDRLDRYELVILDDVESPAGQRAFADLLRSRRFGLLAHDVFRRRGRAVLYRIHDSTRATAS